MTHGATVGVKRSAPNPTEGERNLPAGRFSDVGGADDAKEQIRRSYRDTCIPRDTNGMACFGTASCYMACVARARPSSTDRSSSGWNGTLIIPQPIQRDLQSIIRLLEDPARTY